MINNVLGGSFPPKLKNDSRYNSAKKYDQSESNLYCMTLTQRTFVAHCDGKSCQLLDIKDHKIRSLNKAKEEVWQC